MMETVAAVPADEMRKEAPGDPLPSPFNQIVSLLQMRIGCDFRFYRKSALRRRIQRRMGLHAIEGPQDYLALLRNNPEESKRLFRDLVISVTSFFQDRESMDALEREVIPALVETASDELPVRVWVPGCATGEEAYSIAILLTEEFIRREKLPKIQIFATDIDSSALNIARAGLYAESIAVDVSPKRLTGN